MRTYKLFLEKITTLVRLLMHCVNTSCFSFSWFSWAINSLVKGESAVINFTFNLVLKIEAFSVMLSY